MEILGDVKKGILPIVKTERLVLRQMTFDDAMDILDYAQREEVAYSASFNPSRTIDDVLTYLEDYYLNSYEKRNIPVGYGITLEGQDKVIGSIDFNHRPTDDILEMGYSLHPDYWGQGIMTEAGEAMLEVGFTKLNLYKIELKTFDYNERSQSVAKKLSFKQEGILRGRKDNRGNRCDMCLYGLLKSEWELQNETRV